MKPNWDKILTELSVKVRDGIPDLTNEQHLIKLWYVLKESNWPVDERVRLLHNLTEGTDKKLAYNEVGKKLAKKNRCKVISKYERYICVIERHIIRMYCNLNAI